MKGILKWPLIIAAFLVVVRVVLERAGAPETVNNIFSVVVFYVLIAPLYFAFRIAGSGIAAPYKNLLIRISSKRPPFLRHWRARWLYRRIGWLTCISGRSIDSVLPAEAMWDRASHLSWATLEFRWRLQRYGS